MIEVDTPGGAVWRSRAHSMVFRRWEFELRALTSEEVSSLISLFEACRGGWQTFFFADPAGNLLSWSEDLRKPVWQRSAGLSVTLVPSGGEPAEFEVVNVSALPAGLWQSLDLAPGAAIVFSCEMSGAPGQEITLTAAGVRRRISLQGEWQREFIDGVSVGGLQAVGVELMPGSTVKLRRLQAEMQMAASEYHPTFERGGIFPNTRFAQDGLKIISEAPGLYRAYITLESIVETGT